MNVRVESAPPFRAGAFSTIVLSDVIEHVDDDVGALRVAARLAAPGSRLVITVPAFQFLWSRHDETFEHRRRYSARQLLQVVRAADEMYLDEDTLSNLEIFRPLRGQDTSITLVHQLDACRTTMGSRLLRRWLRAPLRDRQRAAERHAAVQFYRENKPLLEGIRTTRAIRRLRPDPVPRELLRKSARPTRRPERSCRGRAGHNGSGATLGSVSCQGRAI